MTIDLERMDCGSYRAKNDPGEAHTNAPRVSVTREEARILLELSRDKDVIEIGTGLGVSTRALAARSRSVVTVDPDPWVHEHIWPELHKLEVDTAEDIDQIVSDFVFDMAFVDAKHDEESVEKDIMDVWPKLRVGGLIVLHDYNHEPVRLAAERFGKVVRVDTHHGLGLLWIDEK